MPSEKFRINTNGKSLRYPNNMFFGMTLTANLTLDESDASANSDRRSAHNALERQRREHLNNKFQQLAHALPSLQSIRRPSKTMIVAKSLEYVASSIERESSFTKEIQKLREENERLRKQASRISSKLKQEIQIVKEEEKPEVKQEIEQTIENTVEQPRVEQQTSLKRKASDESQLSPPPTPEHIVPSLTSNVIFPSSIVHPNKKRLVKQVKSLEQNVTPTATMEFPWSPSGDNNINLLDISSNLNLNSNTDFFLNDTQSFDSLFDPMLLSPYYLTPNQHPNDFLYSLTNQEPTDYFFM